MERGMSRFSVKGLGRNAVADEISWIAPEGVRERRGVVFRARKSVDRAELAASGEIEITADSYYALYINGTLLDIGPARGTMGCQFLDTHDASSLLKSGENQIAVEVFCNNYPTFHVAPVEPALYLASGHVTTGEDWQVQVAEEYRTEDIEVYTLQLGLTEWRDTRKEPKGWSTFKDCSKWEQATAIPKTSALFQKSLFRRDVKSLRSTEFLPAAIPLVKGVPPLDDPEAVEVAHRLVTEAHHEIALDLSALTCGETVEIPVQSGGCGVTLIVDYASAFSASLAFDLDAPAGTILDVGYQEKIQEGRLNLEIFNYCFADRYILSEGREILTNPLRWRGGRFVQLTFRNFDRPVRIHRLGIIDRRYPIDTPSDFVCDSTAYNVLWERCFATLSACATDTIIDCPWREMAFWVNDFLVVNRFWLQMVGTTDILKRCFALAYSQREENGLIAGVCPTNNNPFFALFATNVFLPIALKDYAHYTGDRAFVREMVGEMADLVRQCETFAAPNGLLAPPDTLWNFVDWSFHFRGQNLNGRNTCVVNWFYVHSLISLASVYEAEGDGERAKAYRKKAVAIAAQIDDTFWSDETECYLEWVPTEVEPEVATAGKLTHALARLSGLLGEERQAKVESALLREDLHLPELYMMHFVFEAFSEMERHDLVHRIIEKYWFPIIESDSSTIWEAGVYSQGKEAYGNSGSMCHAFAIAPVSFFQTRVAGIRPLEDGFKRFSIDPRLGALTRVAASVHTPHGLISTECRQSDSGIKVTLSVPEKCIAIAADGREFASGTHCFVLSVEESVLI